MKYVLIFGLLLSSVFAYAFESEYFHLNPEALQKSLNECPHRAPEGVSCEQLSVIALDVNQLVSELKTDPQAFGYSILLLQQNIATQELKIKNNPSQPELITILEKDKLELAHRMAIVKWLESPASKS